MDSSVVVSDVLSFSADVFSFPASVVFPHAVRKSIAARDAEIIRDIVFLVSFIQGVLQNQILKWPFHILIIAHKILPVNPFGKNNSKISG